MNDMNQEGRQESLPCISVPIFPKYDTIDKVFAIVYLLVGYGFIYIFSGGGYNRMGWNLAIFTVFYVVVVLAYLWGKNLQVPKESWFWLGVLFAIGIPFAFWTVLYLLQILTLIMVAAYWTLSATGKLLDEKKTSQWVFFDGWNAMVVLPFYNYTCQACVLFGGNRDKTQEGEEKSHGSGAAILLGILLAVPFLFLILPLLSSADAGFEHMVGKLVNYIELHLMTVFIRMIFAIPVAAYLYGLIFGGISGRNADRIQKAKLQETGKRMRCVPDEAVCTVLVILSLVYMLFIGLQGKYLFSAFVGVIPQDFTYAEYARRGFFELCQIGFWNLIILGCVKAFSKTESKNHKGLSFLMVLLSVLTLLLIATAISKLGMYISVYGLTVNRILPMVFLIWMALVFACMILRQKKVFPMVRICVMAGAVLFCLLCVFPIENWTMLYNEWARMHGYIM